MKRGKKTPRKPPRKLVCLETCWSDRQVPALRERSVRPFFEGLAAQLEPPLAVAQRFMDSPAQLAAYTRRNEGLLWRDPETFDVPVTYLSFHGSPGEIHAALGRVGPAALCPWENLRAIHASVLADVAPARGLGQVLHLRAG